MSNQAAPSETKAAAPAEGGAQPKSRRKQITVRFLKPHSHTGLDGISRTYLPERQVKRIGEPGYRTVPADTMTFDAGWAETLIKLGIAEEVK